MHQTITSTRSESMRLKDFTVGSSEPVRPRVLLTDTDRRPYAARLAINLSAAGCEVSALSTPNHPLLKTKAVRRTFPYSPFRPLDAILAAIESAAPNVIVPCCDRGVQHLHALHSRLRAQGGAGSDVADLIERSLGPAASYTLVSARYDLLRLAQEEGIRVPQTRVVANQNDLKTWHAEHKLPWVLKSDGTWGGRGVRIVETLADAKKSFLEINRPYGLGRILKRLCVNRDPFWIQPWWNGVRPSVIVQSYIPGRPANCGVVCWEGGVLAGIGVEVVSADGVTGPASVVRVVDNPEMMRCAERIARRLNLSGFFGLDFMIDIVTGAAYLIEMNPRCTPVCHLQLGEGRDMTGAFAAQLAGQPYVAIPAVTGNDLIAYFPQAWSGDRQLLESSFQDIPQDEPDLAQELLFSWPERSFLYRAIGHLHGMTRSAAPVPDSESAQCVDSRRLS
jgi:hypothetical protein